MAENISRIEQLAAANARPVGLSPCAEWDALVAARMERDGCDRSTAVDRCLSQHSELWMRCSVWDAAQPKVVDGIGSGNWGNQGSATLRRISRRP
jgi:hypothetical protein